MSENETIAIKMYGWKWMSFTGIPVKGTPGYPNKCRVRQLLSAQQLASPEWIAFLAGRDAAPATGEEPLAYTYCSSRRTAAVVPYFTEQDDYNVLLQARKIWPKDSEEWNAFSEFLPRATDYRLGDYSKAALKVLED